MSTRRIAVEIKLFPIIDIWNEHHFDNFREWDFANF